MPVVLYTVTMDSWLAKHLRRYPLSMLTP